MKIKIYISLLLAMLLTSCELYMDNYEEPAATEGPDPKEEVVTELDESGAKISYQYTDAVMELTEQHRQYILTNLGDSVFYYNQDTPQAFLPKPGDVLVCKNCEQFPTGFARKVTDVQKSNGMYAVQAIQASYDETFVEFDMDCTDVEYPTMYYNDETTPDGPVFVKPKSRGENTTEIDGIEFTITSDFTFTLSAAELLGPFSGKGTIQIKKYEASLENKFNIWNGQIKKRQISITDFIIDGTFSLECDIKSWNPLKALPGVPMVPVGGVMVVGRPKVSIDFTANMDLDGTFIYRTVSETIIYIDNFSITKDTDMDDNQERFGAGPDVKGTLTGSINLKPTLDFSLGVGFLGDFVEVGLYAKLSITLALNKCLDLNAEPMTIPSPEDPALNRVYAARRNDNLSFTLSFEAMGIYLRVGSNEGKRDDYDKLKEKFEKYNVNINGIGDIVEVGLDDTGIAGYLRLNILEIVKQISGKSFEKVFELPFYPEVNSKDSRVFCRNINFPAFEQYENEISAVLAFNKAGLLGASNLSIIVLDENKEFVMLVECDDTGTILNLNDNHKVYTLIARIEGIETSTANYYFVYPCYKVGKKYYVDREFKVKVKHPSATFYNTHQNCFDLDKEDGKYYLRYTVRTTIDIESTPEIQNWGVVLYISDKNKRFICEEEDLKGFVKIGTTMFERDPSGGKSYMNGKTSISLTLTSVDLDLEDLYFYIMPIYQTCEDPEIHKMYFSAEKVLLKSDPTLIYKYAEEQWDFADQNLSF